MQCSPPIPLSFSLATVLPGSGLITFASTLRALERPQHQVHSVYTRTTRVSNPVRAQVSSLTVGSVLVAPSQQVPRMTGFYPTLRVPHTSPSQVWPCSQNSTLERRIYPRMHQTGYGRFRPNKSDYHLRRRYYRGGGTVLTHPLFQDLEESRKRRSYHALGVPGRCSHCQVFAPAAPRRVWIRVSESISGQCLPTPVRVDG